MRALLLAFPAHSRVMVLYPHESGCTWRAALPDLVLTHVITGRLLRVLAIETRSSMTRRWSERWRELAAQAPLTVIVPRGSALDAERLLLHTDARIVEYERTRDGEVEFWPGI
ncbi:MAG: hypothetical protein M5U28_28105 [Sandaracinaceae bacterium]|nr:hypothetical protein [Sandaracinaceae bacterium]